MAKTKLLLWFAISVLLSHCGDGNPSKPEPRPADVLTDEGWAAFEAGNFALAVMRFDSAKISDANFVEAYNGAGWAYARLDDFEESGENFANALTRSPNLTEARAGATLTNHALDDFQNAIAQALLTLTAAPNFVFSHDSSIDALDIRITLALSYFSEGEFVNAAAQMDIIDPQHSPHSTQADELIQEIMRFFGQIR